MSRQDARPWWHGREDSIDFFALDWEPEDLTRAREMLRNPSGVVPSDIEQWYRGGLGLLTTYLCNLQVPPRNVLAARRDNFLDRPRPFLPSSSGSSGRAGENDEQVAWVDPRRILLKLPGRASLIHDNSNRRAGTVSSVAGIIDFAERIAHQRDDSHSLRALFGTPATELPYIDVEGWALPSGSVFRIFFNGNHRVTALAALGVPCVLARIRWCRGPFDAPCAESIDDEKVGGRIHNYRRLLHTGGAAAFPELGSLNFLEVHTDWPILLESPESACQSLLAAERLVSRTYSEHIGELPRDWFASPEFLDRAATRLAAELARIRAQPVQPHY
ncbi:hypothetical protein JF770_15005 [Mycobacterium intracellulare]|uniref:hypothetical protein n=1 Tax=Mycobacterium intracellulare TaxID=1767 RepID=UPI001CD94C04|nr:hypothetical protein [Mycobacterium intracellulare]MCA2304874.1 hypothetical protein [Mycobacterium intracellulare]MCA2347095.1 hypothetical protein [Mycobacterium intracellulare]